MAENITDRATVNSELMTPEIPAAREAGNAVFIPKCIKDKKYTLAVVAVITALVITIIALAVKKPQPCPLCPPPVDAACPDRWVGYLGKCYYTSEDKRNWSDSESRCSFLGASLAVIDTKPDLDFLWNFTRPSHHWIGLSREAAQPWKWPNGTEFGNQFTVRGEGFCAYINDLGVSSTKCAVVKNFVCSLADACAKRKQNINKRDTL
ncbi:C-type lectin domain family 2 member D-like isoform X1 [Podarcis raffonei]|uniref:C-type lectin domain family 2 member D-like isoform X1 n=1 Tax=Podarcis raffonei TaxID=65483 RepID=UPI002329832D|nr:C-type lectin domain family 2 member D-like isoform X1 [Podarcis raffonei]XP_053234666.1 C-type lectin domain family 2 member D-like isoform X1 [Podarcis raffonei]XP_053234667.1 C-type lectin domain family 2 member D-like isoform X1 [Podarcis raffonei]